MIIRKCVSTTNFNTFLSTLTDDLEATGVFGNTSTTEDSDYKYFKFYYTADEYVELVKPTGSDSISVYVRSSTDGITTGMSNISGYYISYTIITTAAGSFAMAMESTTTNAEADRYTNDLQLYITSINGTKVAIAEDYMMYNSVGYPADLIQTYSGSAMDWVQLVPFGSPELGGVSNEVYMIRYTPATCTEITVGTQAYLFGEKLAIVLEAEND